MKTTPLPLYAVIVCESPLRLWGLTSRQRLERMLRRAGVVNFAEDLESIPAQSSVLLIRGDYLYDDRVISALCRKANVVLRAGAAGAPSSRCRSCPVLSRRGTPGISSADH